MQTCKIAHLFVNAAAGAYKGWMDAEGIHTDLAMLGYVLGGSSVLRGASRGVETAMKIRSTSYRIGRSIENSLRRDRDIELRGDPNPVTEGTKSALIGGGVGAASIGIGYGIGWLAGKVMS